jgi:hypothetical protein
LIGVGDGRGSGRAGAFVFPALAGGSDELQVFALTNEAAVKIKKHISAKPIVRDARVAIFAWWLGFAILTSD